MKQVLLSFIFLLFLFSNSFSQSAPAIQWQRCLGGSQEDYFCQDCGYSGMPKTQVLSRDKSSIFIAGITESTDGDINTSIDKRFDIWVAKLDLSGSFIWKKTIPGYDKEDFDNLIETSDGNLLLIGESYTYPATDAIVIKLDRNGNLLWKKYFGGTASDKGVQIIETKDGNYTFVGSSSSSNGDLSGFLQQDEIWVGKLDQNGSLLWNKKYPGPKTTQIDNGVALKEDNQGNLLIGANILNDSNANSTLWNDDVLLIKMNDKGEELWRKIYAGNRNDDLRGMMLLPSGEILLAGSTASEDGDFPGPLLGWFSTDGFLMRLDQSGNNTWFKRVGGFRYDEIDEVMVLPDNSYLGIGYTESDDKDLMGNTVRGWDAWVFNMTDQGQMRWSKTYGGSGSDIGESIGYISPNNYVFIGRTTSNDFDVSGNHGLTDFWLVKLGSTATIKGSVFYDSNLNGIKDASERVASNVFVTATKGSISKGTTARNGQFTIDVDTGTFNTRAVHPYYTSVPVSKISTFSSYGQTDSFSFALQPIANKKDLSVNIVPVTPARLGFEATYKVYYQNNGTTSITSGQIVFRKDSRVQFISSVPAASSSIGDTLKWNFLNLNPSDTGSIFLKFRVKPPSLRNGDTFSSTVFITPVAGDETPGDDTAYLKQIVTGSYDPNDKYENHGGVITPELVKNGEYLHYTIRFQNIGTDTAFNVVIRDTLENRLDWSTLQMITGSHPYNLIIEDNNKLTWTFSNIHLPDSNKNESASHGFITYRIKPKSNVTVGDTIKNSASIYFDYNLPVQTNIQNSIVKNNVVTAIPDVTITSANFTIFPNPADKMIYIKVDGQVRGQAYLSLVDMKGVEVLKKNLGAVYRNNGFTTALNLNGIPAGPYTILLYVGNQIYRQKLIVK